MNRFVYFCTKTIASKLFPILITNLQYTKNQNILTMGCGTSNQIHEVNTPIPLPIDKASLKQQPLSLSHNRLYLFGQSTLQRKVVCYNAGKSSFTTLMSRIRIPVPKLKWQPIQILYEQTQQIVLPELMKAGPSPPFNFMHAGYCRKDVVFLCGGIDYENSEVSNKAYFYHLNPDSNSSKPKSTIGKNYVRFEETAPMSVARYSHMGIYYNENDGKNQSMYIFGGKDANKFALSSCEKFDLITKRWKDIPSMAIPRCQGHAILFMRSIYIFGGISSFKQHPEQIEVYNIPSNNWRVLDIQLHRGIRSCLIISAKANQILVFGGQTATEQTKSVIRYNLVEQTYVWQTCLPYKLSHVKGLHNGNKVSILVNEHNCIYTFDIGTGKWNNLGQGYKGYVPPIDLHRFACVTESMELRFDPGQLASIHEEEGGFVGKVRQNRQVFIMGNENYPCLLRLSASKTDKTTKFSIKRERISMKLKIKSHMSMLRVAQNYFICGGTYAAAKIASDEAYLFDPDCVTHQSIEPLPRLLQPRYRFSLAYYQGSVYIFGGREHGGEKLSTTCERFNLQEKQWYFAGQNIRPRTQIKTLAFGEEKRGLILLIGGQEADGSPSNYVQIYDCAKQEVVASGQFPALTQGNVKAIKLRKLKESEKIFLSDQDSLLQISQFKSKQQKQQPPILSQSKLVLMPIKQKTEAPSFKNLVTNPITKIHKVQTIHIKPRTVVPIEQGDQKVTAIVQEASQKPEQQQPPKLPVNNKNQKQYMETLISPRHVTQISQEDKDFQYVMVPAKQIEKVDYQDLVEENDTPQGQGAEPSNEKQGHGKINHGQDLFFIEEESQHSLLTSNQKQQKIAEPSQHLPELDHNEHETQFHKFEAIRICIYINQSTNPQVVGEHKVTHVQFFDLIIDSETCRLKLVRVSSQLSLPNKIDLQTELIYTHSFELTDEEQKQDENRAARNCFINLNDIKRLQQGHADVKMWTFDPQQPEKVKEIPVQIQEGFSGKQIQFQGFSVASFY